MVPALRAEDVAKRYGRVRALDGVTLEVQRGELVGVLGPNGAGKSTPVKIACGLIRPSRGQAQICGAPAGSAAARGALGYLAEFFRLPGWYSPDEVLRLHQRLVSSAGGERERGELLELVGLADAARAGRCDVEGHAATAGDRAGARRLTAGAAAGRADERPRPGRPPNRAGTARGVASTGDRRPPQLAPAQRGGARLRAGYFAVVLGATLFAFSRKDL
jgi:energy-coupling factor transporter ATP-binding protein EcfA2